MEKVFVTGANGFVGQHLTKFLVANGYAVVEGSRKIYGDLDKFSNWSQVLQGCDSVVHLAAHVHVMSDLQSQDFEAFRRVNVHASLQIAKAAKELGLRKFVYLSSVKVNGEFTFDQPFCETDRPAPEDAYAKSKCEAEAELMKLHEAGKFEVVIIRPPLIYGQGVKANFLKLQHLIQKQIPLPFGLVNNKRSLVSVKNLSDFILTCLNSAKSGGQTFLVCDSVDYSLKDLLLNLGKVTGRRPILIPIPVNLMVLFCVLIGKRSYAQRLFGNLQVNSSKAKNLLGWSAKYTFEDSFR